MEKVWRMKKGTKRRQKDSGSVDNDEKVWRISCKGWLRFCHLVGGVESSRV